MIPIPVFAIPVIVETLLTATVTTLVVRAVNDAYDAATKKEGKQ